jgi:hypothetical protein
MKKPMIVIGNPINNNKINTSATPCKLDTPKLATKNAIAIIMIPRITTLFLITFTSALQIETFISLKTYL